MKYILIALILCFLHTSSPARVSAFMPGPDWWYDVQFDFVPLRPLPSGIYLVPEDQITDSRVEHPSSRLTHLVNMTNSAAILSINSQKSPYTVADLKNLEVEPQVSVPLGKKPVPFAKVTKTTLASVSTYCEDCASHETVAHWYSCPLNICNEAYHGAPAQNISLGIDQYMLDETRNVYGFGNIERDDRPVHVSIPPPVKFTIYIHYQGEVFPLQTTLTYSLNSRYDPKAEQKGLLRLRANMREYQVAQSIRALFEPIGFDPFMIPFSRRILSVAIWMVSIYQTIGIFITISVILFVVWRKKCQ